MIAVHALSIHADYRCARSGACCTSAWPIPVERALDARLRRALDAGRLDLRAAVAAQADLAPAADRLLPPAADGDGEHAAVLGHDARGRCVFFEPGREARAAACALHRQLGPDALPVACRLFPRVCLIEPRGLSITLSHYCPGAAALLFRDDVALEIVRDPPAFPAQAPYEGLDARAALPSLLRPDALCDWESHALWETHAVATLARDDLTPEAALDRLAAQAEAARAWRVERGPLADWLRACVTATSPPAGDGLPREGQLATSARPAPRPEPDALRRVHGLAAGRAGDLELFRRALDCVPAPARALLGDTAAVAADAPALDAADARHVAPAWGAFARPVRRYLAAHAFASWCAHQGRGLRTRVLHLGAVLAVLRVQAARVASRAGRRLDRELFLEAVRASDLLLVHLASREALAASLAACEGRRA